MCLLAALLASLAGGAARGAVIGVEQWVLEDGDAPQSVRSFLDQLEAAGHRVVAIDDLAGDGEAIGPSLSDVDAFILVQASQPKDAVKPADARVLVRFVADTKNLLVIANPRSTATATALNNLASGFGVTFSDAAEAIPGGEIPVSAFESNEKHRLVWEVQEPLRLAEHRPILATHGHTVSVTNAKTSAELRCAAVRDGVDGWGNVIFLSSPELLLVQRGEGHAAFAEAVAEMLTKRHAMLTHPVALLAVLLGVLALIFWFGETGVGGRVYRVVPKLVFCYFVPTTLTTLGVLPDDSALYEWIKVFLLPASLLLLILALDLPGIVRLGPKAVIMLLAGTTGVVLGAPLALLIFQAWVPDDTWQGMAALTGSWIGGGANMVALGQIAGTTGDMFGKMIIVDVFIANIWMGILLYAAGEQERIDKWTGADTSTIEQLKKRVAEFEAKVTRIPSLTDLIIIAAFGFVGSYLCFKLGNWLGGQGILFGSTVWKFILVTSLALLLSFTPARKLDGAGASKIGSVFLYLLVASIGAHANFNLIRDAPMLVALGAVWMLVHIVVLLVVARIIRAPIFFVAVGSQANIGGAASAPIVASAFHPTLAPVGVLLAVAGYVLGTYAGLLCIELLKLVAGVDDAAQAATAAAGVLGAF